MTRIVGFICTVLLFLSASTLHAAPMPAPKLCDDTADPKSPATSCEAVFSLVGGLEWAELSSKPLVNEPFVRFFLQSGAIRKWRLWASVRLLGSPNQTDTNGIFSVFADPTGQITTQKLSSVGTAVDWALGPSYRISPWDDPDNSVDIFLGFGATTPLESNTVTEAFKVPAFGTAECNILYTKFADEFSSSEYSIQKSPDGIATGSTTACLLNKNSATTSKGNTTYAPTTILAFSNPDRTSFLLKDFVGIRFNHTEKDSKTDKCSETNACSVGTLDFSFGHDSAITGGILRGKRVVFKTDGVYPMLVKGSAAVYIFGSFATRFARNQTDNTPLILQAASLPTLTGSGSSAVPNVNTVVFPLAQPDRDFYRIGVGIDVIALIKTKKK